MRRQNRGRVSRGIDSRLYFRCSNEFAENLARETDKITIASEFGNSLERERERLRGYG